MTDLAFFESILASLRTYDVPTLATAVRLGVLSERVRILRKVA